MHNLSPGVSGDMEIPWLLGLGFQLSYKQWASSYRNDVVGQEWYSWLHVLQSKVVSRIAGQPLVAFRHDRAPLFEAGGEPSRDADDGVIVAQYGDVKVLANLGDIPRTVEGKRLAPYGYHVEAPGLLAAKLDGEDPFVRTGRKEWLFKKSDLYPGGYAKPPKEAPANAGTAPLIGILDMKGLPLARSTISPDEWERAILMSSFGTSWKARIVRLRTVKDMEEALGGGSMKFFAIINPYGEIVPAASPGCWRETIGAIRNYVQSGGNWFETGGAPFTVAFCGPDEKGEWHQERLKGGGMGFLGLSVLPFGFIPDSLQGVRLAHPAENWFSGETLALVNSRRVMVNRGVSGAPDPVLPLIVTARDEVWFGGNRLGGIGTFWRTGGTNPDAQLLKAVVTDVLLHQWTTPPEPVPHVKIGRVIRE